VSEIRKMDCQFGSHYYKEKNTGKDRTCLQGTRKLGCTAQIEIFVITMFPDFQLSAIESTAGVKKLKEVKQQKLQELRSNITESLSSVRLKCCYYVVLPTEQAHHNYHRTDGAVLFAQRVHPKLVAKIYELVATGIANTEEVKSHLKQYVLHDLCPQQKPNITDRAYFPTTVDIRNHIYLAQRACQLSKFDQENLRLKIEQWKKDDPTSHFFYRPLVTTEDTQEETRSSMNQTLLFVHQESWQRDLLSRYGNTISLMDATYKTTKYEIALFFITVKTNVGYSVVAEFVIQSETKENISEALGIVLSWNPQWSPPFFMTDYSEAEIGAIESVFPNCKVYICDFHREQCWERWVKERKHGLTTDNADTLLSFLRDIANSPSPTSPDLPVDHHYKEHVDSLKSGNIWRNNLQLQEWLQKTWLSCPEVHNYMVKCCFEMVCCIRQNFRGGKCSQLFTIRWKLFAVGPTVQH